MGLAAARQNQASGSPKPVTTQPRHGSHHLHAQQARRQTQKQRARWPAPGSRAAAHQWCLIQADLLLRHENGLAAGSRGRGRLRGSAPMGGQGWCEKAMVPCQPRCFKG